MDFSYGTSRKRKAETKFTMINCYLCYHQFFEEKKKSCPQKFPEICFKYLHPAFKQESLSSQLDDNICQKCSKSAMKLVDLSEQLELIQNTITELAFTFSLEILHRRGKDAENNGEISKKNSRNSEGKKLIELDISALPNLESWNSTTNYTFNAPSPSELKSQSSGNFYTPEYHPGTTENETNPNVIEAKENNDMDWINEAFDSSDDNSIESPKKMEKSYFSKTHNKNESQLKMKLYSRKENLHRDRGRSAFIESDINVVANFQNHAGEQQIVESRSGFRNSEHKYQTNVRLPPGNKRRFSLQKRTRCIFCMTKGRRATATVTGCSNCHRPICADHQDTTIFCPSCKNSHTFVVIPAGDEVSSIQLPPCKAPVNLSNPLRVVSAKNENDFEDDDDNELLAAVTTLEH